MAQTTFEEQKKYFMDAVAERNASKAGRAFDAIARAQPRETALPQLAGELVNLPNRQDALFGIYSLLMLCRNDGEHWAVLEKVTPQFIESVTIADLDAFKPNKPDLESFLGKLGYIRQNSQSPKLASRANSLLRTVSVARDVSTAEDKPFENARPLAQDLIIRKVDYIPSSQKIVPQSSLASLELMNPSIISVPEVSVQEVQIPQFLRTVYGRYGNDTGRLLQSLQYLAQGLTEQLAFGGRQNPEIGRKYIETFPQEMLPDKDGNIKSIDQWYDLFGDMSAEDLKKAANRFVSLCRQGNFRDAFASVSSDYGVQLAEVASSVREQSLRALEVPLNFRIWDSGFISLRGEFLRGKKFSFKSGEGFSETTLANLDAWVGKTFLVADEDRVLLATAISTREADMEKLGKLSPDDLVLKVQAVYSPKTGGRLGLGEAGFSYERDVSGRGQRLGLQASSREFNIADGLFIKGGASYLGVREGKGFLKTFRQDLSGSRHDLRGGTGGEIYSLDAAIMKRWPGRMKELSLAVGNSWAYWAIPGEFHQFDYSSSLSGKLGAKIDLGKDILLLPSAELGKTRDGNYVRVGLGLQVK